MNQPQQQSHLARTYAGRLVTGLSLATILALTLYPTRSRTAEWTCIFCGTFSVADAILNVLLFVPFGAGLALMRVPLKRSLFVAILVPIAIELAQSGIPGRDASIGDLITNTFGCGIGYGAIMSATWCFLPSHRQASLLSLVAAVVVVGSVTVTGGLVQPSFPQSRYFAQWTPDFDHMARYRGKVLDARIGLLALPPQSVEQTDSFTAMWFDGDPIRIRAVTGPPVFALAPLFSISDNHEREILLVGPDRRDLVFRYRTRSISWRLHQPAITIPDGMAQDLGDTTTIDIWRDGKQHCVTVNADRHCGLGFTAGMAWTLLIGSSGFSAGLTTLLNAAWVAVLLLPLGFWTRPSLGSVGTLAIAVLGLTWVPQAVGLLATPVTEWLGAAAGYGTGAWLGTLARRVQNHAPSGGSPHVRAGSNPAG